MPKTVHTLRVDAIVLRHSDYGEADRLLTLYTREQGKLRAIAKGVRKLQSRKAGHLEPFTRVVLMLAHGHDLWIVTQAETVNAFQPLRESLALMSEASYVVELLERFIYEEGQNVQVLICWLPRSCGFRLNHLLSFPIRMVRNPPVGSAWIQAPVV